MEPFVTTSAWPIRFAKMGAQVVLWDINKEANDAVAEEIKMKGQTAFAFHCDCSDREAIYQTAAQVSSLT